jgi:hypothetical protein
MKLIALSSFEELLERADMLINTFLKRRMAGVYQDILSNTYSFRTLPKSTEIINGKSGGILFFGQWKNRIIKIQLGYEEKKRCLNPVLIRIAKKLAIKAKSENAEKIGFVVPSSRAPGEIQSAINVGQRVNIDLGLYKKPEEQNGKRISRLYILFATRKGYSMAQDGNRHRLRATVNHDFGQHAGQS